MSSRTTLLAAALGIAVTPALAGGTPSPRVVLISVDGMHAFDLEKYIATHPASNLATIAAQGVRFPKALTTAPSDSFPGMLAQVTGGTPKTNGVYYDDSYDRLFYPPVNAGGTCSGPAGAETTFAENIDRDNTRLDAGGTIGDVMSQIDPNNLPQTLDKNGNCVKVLPHQFVRTNTIFGVLHAAGKATAWSDKHAAYEILNGREGGTIDELYTPEVNSNNILGGSGDNTKSFAAIRTYDDVKVGYVLNWINGVSASGSGTAFSPAILGMNFQSVSVGQKLASSKNAVDAGLTGGYADANGTPGNALAQQLDYVDGAIGRMWQAVQASGQAATTLFIISAKHGQAPVDITKLNKIDDGAVFGGTPGLAFEIADDGLLMWLTPGSSLKTKAQAQKFLTAGRPGNGLTRIFRGANNPFGFPDPATDDRAPDFVGVTQLGVVYTTSSSKISEHGGYSLEDRNVPLLVAGGPVAAAERNTIKPGKVLTTQIAPTILQALGQDPMALDAVKAEGTKVLPVAIAH